jgi:hypothetical protein
MLAERHRAIATIFICFMLFVNMALLAYPRSPIYDLQSSAEPSREPNPVYVGTV